MYNANTRTEGHWGILLIELHYLPCIEYFTHLIRYDQIVLEAAEHYQKQTYRNRCQLLTSQKVLTLSVPVCKGEGKQQTREVRIDHSQSWLKDHWRTMSTAYGKAPFFSDYAPFFEQVLLKKHRYLFDLNYELLTNCLFLLGLKKNIDITSAYQSKLGGPVKDLRNTVQLEKEGFTEKTQKGVPYRQVFGNNFASNLSIIDLLFCQGPAAINIIRESIFL